MVWTVCVVCYTYERITHITHPHVYMMTISPHSLFLQDKCHPQTIEVCRTRADGLGLQVVVSDEKSFDVDKDTCGVLLQYPATDGSVHDYKVCIVLVYSLCFLCFCVPINTHAHT